MLELSPRRTVTPQAPTPRGNQQSRLLVALVLLLGALAAVLIKDRQFWFGSDQTIVDADVVQPAAASQTATSAPAVPATSPAVHAAKKQVAAAKTPAASNPVETPAITTTRTLLPPLDVEVVAGDAHHKLRPGSNATKLEIAKAGSAPARPSAPATNAAQRERIADVAQPAYPPLAQHMNVQGSVVLQALIGADGAIQNLRVMSGPAILSTAAQQAVREWRFKPVLQNGQAVETRATITVNFTIKVADSSAQTTLAESVGDNTLIITR
jgi:TonB family protein